MSINISIILFKFLCDYLLMRSTAHFRPAILMPVVFGWLGQLVSTNKIAFKFKDSSCYVKDRPTSTLRVMLWIAGRVVKGHRKWIWKVAGSIPVDCKTSLRYVKVINVQNCIVCTSLPRCQSQTQLKKSRWPWEFNWCYCLQLWNVKHGLLVATRLCIAYRWQPIKCRCLLAAAWTA